MAAFFRFVDKAMEAVAALCLAASVALVCANVFHRYVVLDWLRNGAGHYDLLQWVYRPMDAVFGSVSVTADEIPGYLLVWISFLGAYLTLRRGGHIRFGVLVGKLPPGPRRRLEVAGGLFTAGFWGLVLWQSVRMMRIDGATEIETVNLAQGWFMAVLPWSAALLIIALLVNAVRPERNTS